MPFLLFILSIGKAVIQVCVAQGKKTVDQYPGGDYSRNGQKDLEIQARLGNAGCRGEQKQDGKQAEYGRAQCDQKDRKGTGILFAGHHSHVPGVTGQQRHPEKE